MNFWSSDAGACGAVIFWKHVGHSITVPLRDESHIMCWPHTGQANLNSLMAAPKHFTSMRRWQRGFSILTHRRKDAGTQSKKTLCGLASLRLCVKNKSAYE
jgi:hypothetical protein